MADTFKETLANDVEDVFLHDTATETGDDRWSGNITHFPLGAAGPGTTVAAVVDRDDEEGSNQVAGEGRVLERDDGVRRRRTAVIEIPSSVSVNEEKDIFGFDGLFWKVIRRLGHDPYMQSYLVAFTDIAEARRAARRG